MDIYQYRARNKVGDLVQGTIEATNQSAVVNWLFATGLSPIEIKIKADHLKDQPKWIQSLQSGGSLKSTDLFSFTRQFGALIKAGVPLIQAINGLKSGSSGAMTELLRSLHSSLDRGMELSAAMAEHPKFFDSYYRSMVRVGENSGKLDEIFQRLFIQLDFDLRMKKKIKSVMRYPTFVLTALGIAMVIVMVFVIPKFIPMFEKSQIELPVITRFLIDVSNLFSQKWWLLAGIAALVVFVIKSYLSREDGLYKWDRYKLSLPVFGSLIRKGTTSRLCRSFATAIKSGVPIVEALNLVSKVVDNKYYEQRVGIIRDAVTRGDTILRGCIASALFKPMEIQLISVGEDIGDVDGMISQLAVIYEEEVEYEASRLAESLEPILLGVMAVLVLILLLGIFQPMWSMTQLAGR